MNMTRRNWLKMGACAAVAAGIGPGELFPVEEGGRTPGVDIRTYTSGEPAAMSNSHLVIADRDAFLFDVVQMRHEALNLVEMIRRSGKKLRFVWISHAHPDHFLGLDVIEDAFPGVPVYSSPAVSADIAQAGPTLVGILSKRWGEDGPRRLVVPKPYERDSLELAGARFQIRHFSNGESRHLANIQIMDTNQVLTADIVYDRTHLFLREKNIDGWLAQLREFEDWVGRTGATLYPGHGLPGSAALVTGTRRYLEDFKAALTLSEATKVREVMLAKYPDYAMRRLLTDYTLPAFFPDAPVVH
jgi:glyoxylase-like metal-dependent hydrolase (beta-lactamase superfamily II)